MLVIGTDDGAHRAAALIAKTVGGALQAGFLPAAPAPRAWDHDSKVRPGSLAAASISASDS